MPLAAVLPAALQGGPSHGEGKTPLLGNLAEHVPEGIQLFTPQLEAIALKPDEAPILLEDKIDLTFQSPSIPFEGSVQVERIVALTHLPTRCVVHRPGAIVSRELDR